MVKNEERADLVSKVIFITSADQEKLLKMIGLEKEFHVGDKDYLQSLACELEQAVIMRPQEIPGDVITMRSQVVLQDLDNDEQMTWTLVYPEEADLAEDKISVLAPVGTAILGYRVGDVVNWEIPSGLIRLQVKEILFQPESSGNFDL